jgi:hypothetical protein
VPWSMRPVHHSQFPCICPHVDFLYLPLLITIMYVICIKQRHQHASLIWIKTRIDVNDVP